MIPFIDLTRQHAALRNELIAAAARVVDSSQFVLGAEGKALERELAALCGVRWALGVASGTDALRLALAALDVGAGDEVITHAPYWPTIPEQVKLVGATPVIVQTRADDGFAVHAEAIIAAITSRTKAIIINCARCSRTC